MPEPTVTCARFYLVAFQTIFCQTVIRTYVCVRACMHVRARRSARVHDGLYVILYESQRVHNKPVKALSAVLVVLAPLKAPLASTCVVRTL